MTPAALRYDVQFKRVLPGTTNGVDRMALRANRDLLIAYKKQSAMYTLTVYFYYARMTRATCGGDVIAMYHRLGIGLRQDKVAAMAVRARCGHQEAAFQNTLTMYTRKIFLIGVRYGYIMSLCQFFIGVAFPARGRKAEWIDH